VGRWIKTPGKPSEETYECTLYGTEVVQTAPDMTEAAKQLRHANEQLAIAGAYPGRERARHAARSVKPEARAVSIYRRPKYRSVAPTHNGI
jgi:hypothetical protein